MKISELHKIPLKELVILCGAGISYDHPTNLPTVNSFLHGFLKNLINETHFSESDLKTYYEKKSSPRFELLLDEIVNTVDNKVDVNKIFTSENYNKNHSLIGQLCQNGAKVITTNFDQCIENTFENNNPNVLIYKGSDLTKKELKNINHFDIIKPHGCVSTKSKENLVITLSNLNLLNHGFRSLKNWQKGLKQILNNKYLVVLGYSGSDDFDITPLALDSKVKKIIWINYKNSAKKLSPVKNASKVLLNKFGSDKRLLLYNGKISFLNRTFKSKIKSSNISISILDTKINHFITTTLKTKEKKYSFLYTLLYHSNCYELLLNVDSRNKGVKRSRGIFYNLLRSFYKLGKYNDVIRIFHLMDKSRVEDSILLQATFHVTAAYYFIGNNKKSNYYLEELLENCKKQNNQQILIDALIHKASLFINEGKPNQALTVYQQTETLLKKTNYIHGNAVYNWGMGSVHTSMQSNSKIILKYFNKALEIYHSLGITQGLSQLYYNIGTTYLTTQDYKNTMLNLTLGYQNAVHGKVRNVVSVPEQYAVMGLLKATIFFDKPKRINVNHEQLNVIIGQSKTFTSIFELSTFNLIYQHERDGNIIKHRINNIEPSNKKEQVYKKTYFELLSLISRKEKTKYYNKIKELKKAMTF